jgi:long-subunit fatty acid transport protein
MRAKSSMVAMALALGAGLFTRAPVARAAGIEDLVQGAVGTGRAAAVGRANDFLATVLNPANLAVVPRLGGGFEARIPILQGCYQRAYDERVQYKQPGISSTFVGTESFADECNRARPVLAGNLGFAMPIKRRWGVGLGVFTPPAVGGSRYGSNTVLTVFPSPEERYTPTLEGVSSSTRQMGMARDGVTATLMAGVGFMPVPWLRMGVSLGYGVASVYSRSVVSVRGGSFRDAEILAEVRAHSWFIPRATGSVVLSPTKSFDVFAVATYQGDIRAKGTLDLTANGITGAPRTNCRSATPGSRCRIDDVELTVPFPKAEITAGFRYAHLRRERARGMDPMRDEWFDVEVQGVWTKTSDVDEFRLKIHDAKPGDDLTNAPKVQLGNADTASVSYVKTETTIPKFWKDTLSVRAGMDVQVLPGRLTLRGGASWASSATPIEYMNIDYWPVQKIGMHFGASVAVSNIKIHAAWAHLFYQPVNVAVGTGRVVDSASTDDQKSTGVNEGYFRAMQDIFSLQVNATF